MTVYLPGAILAVYIITTAALGATVILPWLILLVGGTAVQARELYKRYRR